MNDPTLLIHLRTLCVFITGLIINGPLLQGAAFHAFIELIGGYENIQGTVLFLNIRTIRSLMHNYIPGVSYPAWSLRDVLHAVATDHCTLIGLRVHLPKIAFKAFQEVFPRFRLAFFEAALGADCLPTAVAEFVKSLLVNYMIGSPIDRENFVKYLLRKKVSFILTGKYIPGYLQTMIDAALARNKSPNEIAAHKLMITARATADRIAQENDPDRAKVTRKRKRELVAQDVVDPNAPANNANGN